MEVTLLQNFLAYAKSVLGLGPKQQLLQHTSVRKFWHLISLRQTMVHCEGRFVILHLIGS
jgi:hypothetical protein